MAVRVRFAPSPTGSLHLGGLRTALFNWLFARKNGGACILRIEDTDQTRLVPGAAEKLQEDLAWAGITFDEGPFGDDRDRYIQSKRVAHYQQLAQQLVEQKHAYPCFCSSSRLETLRAVAHKTGLPTSYDRHCRHLSSEQVQELLADKTPHTIRLAMPTEGVSTVHDLVYGNVQFDNSVVEDQILLKSDGFPTYHLANVIDDHDMGITHVMRGEEWLPSVPKHLQLYKSFGWDPPTMIHLPLLVNPDRSKLSKRKGDMFVSSLRERGFLPSAVTNFSALLGWTPTGAVEGQSGHEEDSASFYDLEKLVKEFSIDSVARNPAIVDMQRLSFINTQHIRAAKHEDHVFAYIVHAVRRDLDQKAWYQAWARGRDDAADFTQRVVRLCLDTFSELSQFSSETVFFFVRDFTFDASIKAPSQQAQHVLADVATRLEAGTPSRQALEDACMHHGVGVKKMMQPLRQAVTGQKRGPPLHDVIALLGAEESSARLRSFASKCDVNSL